MTVREKYGGGEKQLWSVPHWCVYTIHFETVKMGLSVLNTFLLRHLNLNWKSVCLSVSKILIIWIKIKCGGVQCAI